MSKYMKTREMRRALIQKQVYATKTPANWFATDI